METKIQLTPSSHLNATLSGTASPALSATLSGSAATTLRATLSGTAASSLDATLSGTAAPVLNASMTGNVSRGIKDATIDINGHLIFTFTDGRLVDAGCVVGAASVSIHSIDQTVVGEGDEAVNEITVRLTDGTVSVFRIQNGSTGAPGPAGPAGPAGQDGSQGPAGADGVSPVITSNKTGKVTTLTITDKDGTRPLAVINDGADGTGGTGGSIAIDAAMSEISTNPVQNKVVNAAINDARAYALELFNSITDADGRSY
jgi:hypothetical protein